MVIPFSFPTTWPSREVPVPKGTIGTLCLLHNLRIWDTSWLVSGNRTACDIRAIFSKCGGNLGENGSVSFMFNHYGKINVPISVMGFEEIFDLAIECGAEDCDLSDDFYEISCSTEELHQTANLLESKIQEDLAAQLSWKPINVVNVDEESAHKIINMVNSLDDHDDVQEVFSNFDISEDLLDKL